MAVSKCACAKFPTSHYRVSRKGPGNTTGPAILLICTDEERPGIQDNIQYMETFFLSLNLRIYRLPIRTPHGLESALKVITNPGLLLSKSTRKIPESIWNARILKEDSICFIGIIANGNNACTRLSKGTYVNDVNIEEFFNEDNCVLLRGKPKLFLYFKYYLHVQYGTETVPLTPPNSPDEFSGMSWQYNSTSSTSMNLMSCYMYDFGIGALLTKSLGSVVLKKLSTAYTRECDILSLFRILLDEMITLIESDQRIKEQIHSCISIERIRLRSKLFFLQPICQLANEEQDSEESIPSLSTHALTHYFSPKKSLFPRLDSCYPLFSTQQSPSNAFSQAICPIKQIFKTNTALQPKPVPNNGQLSHVIHHKAKSSDEKKRNSSQSSHSSNPFRRNENEFVTQISETQDVPPKKQKAKRKRHRKICVSDAIDNSNFDQLPRKKAHTSE